MSKYRQNQNGAQNGAHLQHSANGAVLSISGETSSAVPGPALIQWITTRADEVAYFVALANCDTAAQTLSSLSTGNFRDSKSRQFFEAAVALQARDERITPESLSGECDRRALDCERQSDAEGWQLAAQIALCELATVPSGRETLGARAERLTRKIRADTPLDFPKFNGLAPLKLPEMKAAEIPEPKLRTPRGAPDFDERQLVEILHPDWKGANLSSQVALGQRAGEVLGDLLRYVPALGWLWFDGKKWTLDDKAATGAGTRVAALSEHVRAEGAALYEIAALLAKSGRSPDAEAMGRAAGLHLRHTKQVESRGFVDGALSFAAAHPALRSTVETFNLRPYVLGFQNGVWDKGEFRAHRREDFLLHVCPVDFDSKADRRQWEAVLERMTGGDLAFAQNLQDVAGYVLAGAPNLRTLPWLYGPKGTGKSTFAELLQTVLGEQSAQIDTKALDGSESRERLGAVLWNRRLAICSESGNKKLDAELLKTLSGGDRLPVRLLFKEAFTVLPHHVLMMVANDAPRLDAYDVALKDRVLALPFEHAMDGGPHFELTGADGSPLARLEAARVDPASSLVLGFTAWALDGLERIYRTQSIERAPCVVAATAKFWSDTDSLTPFWESIGDEQFEALNFKGVTKTELRQCFEQWCEDEGQRPLGRVQWARACESYGLEDCRLFRHGLPEARGWRFNASKQR